MLRLFAKIFTGDGLFVRVARGSALIGFSHVASQVIRLAANLVLTRLLFPEAFGLMALLMVFIIGVGQFSDVGVGPSIQQSKRGDEPAFLETAWTIQAVRGVILWIALCLLAWPASLIYNEPMLIQYLPVAGLSLVVSGFMPIRVETAGRHLRLGRLTALDLIGQLLSGIITIVLAWQTRSVWALVISLVLGSLITLVLTNLFLPGARDRFRWEAAAAHELIHFGKWILLSTAFGFILLQGDKAILGYYISLELLGVYNIGQVLATAPLMLAAAITGRVLIPLYREHAAAPNPDGDRRIRQMRYLLTGSVLALQLSVAFCGVWIVGLLYDARYAAAGAIIVVSSVVQIPHIVGLTYDQAALAAGDSRRFFRVIAAQGTVQTIFFVIGLELGGLLGALIAQGIALLFLHGAVIWIARIHKVWDARHDLIYMVSGLALGGLAIWLNWDSILLLASVGTTQP